MKTWIMIEINCIYTCIKMWVFNFPYFSCMHQACFLKYLNYFYINNILQNIFKNHLLWGLFSLSIAYCVNIDYLYAHFWNSDWQPANLVINYWPSDSNKLLWGCIFMWNPQDLPLKSKLSCITLPYSRTSMCDLTSRK